MLIVKQKPAYFFGLKIPSKRDKNLKLPIDELLLRPEGLLGRLEGRHKRILKEWFFLPDDNDIELPRNLNLKHFYKGVKAVLQEEVTYDEVRQLFNAIDVYSTGEIGWSDFVLYSTKVFMGLYNTAEKAKIPPFSKHPSTRKLYRLYDHDFTAVMKRHPDITGDPMSGGYISLSRKGILLYWQTDEMLFCKKYIQPKIGPNVILHYVTAMAIVAEYGLIAVGTCAHELHFYPTAWRQFRICCIIFYFPYVITSLDFCYKPHERECSLLLIGDMGGNIKFLWMMPEYFKKLMLMNMYKVEPVRISYKRIDQDRITGLHLWKLEKVHTDDVLKVMYICELDSFICCARTKRRSLYIWNLTDKTGFYIKPLGKLLCMDYCQSTKMIVTGSEDCDVKVWAPDEPWGPKKRLVGHSNPVISVTVDNPRKLAFSLSIIRLLVIWHLESYCMLQYIMCDDFRLGNSYPTAYFYDDVKGRFMIHTNTVAILKANRKKERYVTHNGALCGVLYSNFFDCVVTGAFDSTVSVWNVATGRKQFEFWKAHTVIVNKIVYAVRMFEMKLDNSQSRLATCGADRLVKIWNFHTGVCLRTFSTVGKEHIYALAFLKYELYCGGISNRLSVYFDDGSNSSRPPTLKDLTDVYDSEVNAIEIYKDTLVLTGLDEGAILIWNRKLQVVQDILTDFGSELNAFTLHQTKLDRYVKKRPYRKFDYNWKNYSERPCQVFRMMCLHTRPLALDVATVVTLAKDTLVRLWSICPKSGLLARFNPGIPHWLDIVRSVATDLENKYLFTGLQSGWVRVWLLEGYCHGDHVVPSQQMDEYMKRFTYLKFKQKILDTPKLRKIVEDPMFFPISETSPKQRDPKLVVTECPFLLNSFLANKTWITYLQYVDKNEMLITGGFSGAVRMWRLTGEYIGYLGGEGLYDVYSRPQYTPEMKRPMPDDVRKCGSTFTLKVMNMGGNPLWVRAKKAIKYYKKISMFKYWLADAEMKEKMRTSVKAPLRIENEPMLGRRWYKLPTDEPVRFEDYEIYEANNKTLMYTKMGTPPSFENIYEKSQEVFLTVQEFLWRNGKLLVNNKYIKGGCYTIATYRKPKPPPKRVFDWRRKVKVKK